MAHSIEELTPHLDHILSDVVTAKQRQSFREHDGRARVFDLSNESYRFNERMNALCSEKAREIVFQKRSMNRARMKPVSFFNPNIATILRWVRLGWIFS